MTRKVINKRQNQIICLSLRHSKANTWKKNLFRVEFRNQAKKKKKNNLSSDVSVRLAFHSFSIHMFAASILPKYYAINQFREIWGILTWARVRGKISSVGWIRRMKLFRSLNTFSLFSSRSDENKSQQSSDTRRLFTRERFLLVFIFVSPTNLWIFNEVVTMLHLEWLEISVFRRSVILLAGCRLAFQWISGDLETKLIIRDSIMLGKSQSTAMEHSNNAFVFVLLSNRMSQWRFELNAYSAWAEETERDN